MNLNLMSSLLLMILCFHSCLCLAYEDISVIGDSSVQLTQPSDVHRFQGANVTGELEETEGLPFSRRLQNSDRKSVGGGVRGGGGGNTNIVRQPSKGHRNGSPSMQSQITPMFILLGSLAVFFFF